MTLLQRSFQAVFKQNVMRPPVAMGSGSGLNLGGLITGDGVSNNLSQMQAMTQTSWLFAVVDRIAASTAAIGWQL